MNQHAIHLCLTQRLSVIFLCVQDNQNSISVLEQDPGDPFLACKTSPNQFIFSLQNKPKPVRCSRSSACSLIGANTCYRLLASVMVKWLKNLFYSFYFANLYNMYIFILLTIFFHSLIMQNRSSQPFRQCLREGAISGGQIEWQCDCC